MEGQRGNNKVSMIIITFQEDSVCLPWKLALFAHMV